MSIHDFTLDELLELLGHYTTITLNNNKKPTIQGYLYTVDPDTRHVVLYTDQTVQVVMSHSIDQVTSKRNSIFIFMYIYIFIYSLFICFFF
jgi:hypothetical protein